jgi:threonylcarbamoyladenosine tRNA methylthiotransferase MtaB
MSDQVPQHVRYERGERLRQLSMKKRHFFNQSFQGQVKEVLFENEIENGMIFGWTDNYLRVGIPFEEGLLHRIVPVLIGEHLDEERVRGVISERIIF